jgi:hypothetical protein
MFSGVFIAEEVDGVGDKGSGNTTAVDVQTIFKASISPRCACFTDEAFLWSEAKLPVLGLFSSARLSGFPDYRISD